jgi:hypothetical protein
MAQRFNIPHLPKKSINGGPESFFSIWPETPFLFSIDRLASFGYILAMSLPIKAFLLSALVFPGLGQLYKQDRRKGVILILLANLMLGVVLLSGMIHLSQEYIGAFYPEPLTWEVLRPLLFTVLSRPLFWLPFMLLVAIWAFAAVDAGLSRAPAAEED